MGAKQSPAETTSSMMKLLLIALVALVPFAVAEWTEDMEKGGNYEGDIVLDPEEMKNVLEGKFAFASIKTNRWPKTIPYSIDSSLSRYSRATNAIKAALAQYHKYTCLRFVPRRSERAYLHFYMGRGCSSPVGNHNRKNSISLASGCWRQGTIMHEIGHSLGLYHEQSRPDRDNYVEIIWNNINPRSMSFNFNKQPADKINSMGTPYDYRSMMHYGKTAFGRGRTTIRTKQSYYQDKIGQRSGFSEIDKKQINLMYCQ